MKNQKGITLTSLIVTIIVMVILAGIALLFSVGEEGIIERANESKRKTELAEFKEKVGLEYLGLKNNENNKDKTTLDLFKELKDKMLFNTEFEGNECMIIKYDEETYITLLKDGTIIDGKRAILNIADGNIVLRPDGFYQTVESIISGNRWYNNEVTNTNNYTIKFEEDIKMSYLITGTSTDNMIVIYGNGEYDITIKDLYINLEAKENVTPLNLNGATKPTNLNIKLNIEGENSLYGGRCAPGISFSKATYGEDGARLEINGTGSLYAKGGNYAAGIGSGYGYSVTAGDVNNITINSGNITAQAGVNGSGIGGGLYASVNNIVINGGNINAIASNRYGIGTGGNGLLENLVINGGNIVAIGGEYGGAIGGGQGSGEIIINGGEINLQNNSNYSHDDATLGDGTNSVEIKGGNIYIYSKKGMGIGNYSSLPFKLNKQGGEISVDDRICSTPVNIENGILYLAKFKIGDLAKEIQITKVETTNNIEYEANNLYTSRDGHLYMFVPEGEVTVSVTIAEKTYTGTINVTPENTEVFVLN